jgi:hypothetical protein
MDKSEAHRIMSAGLARSELEFATSICAPLYWIIRKPDGQFSVRNGTAFFLNTGSGLFAVTAAHVLSGLEHDQSCQEVVAVQLGRDLKLDLNGRHAVIDRNNEIDIATFHITANEIYSLSKTILTGRQDRWPPAPPQEGRGIYFSGFPGRETLPISKTEISFGAVPGSGVAHSVSERDICTLFDRNQWIDVLGLGVPPVNYDFGGLSGGPLLSVIERNGLRTWTLAGVIYQGPNPSTDRGQSIPEFEVIIARRAQFIAPDGQLDMSYW